MISTPLISSPWIAADSHNLAPSSAPCSTRTGMVTITCVGMRPTGISMLARWPRETSFPPILSKLESSISGTPAAFGRTRVLFDVLDDLSGDVLARSRLDAFEPRR